MTETCNIAASLPRLAPERPDQVAMRCPGTRGGDGFARYDVALTYAELDARSDAIAAGPGPTRHRSRHAHGDHGATVAGVLPVDVRAVQGRRRAGAGGPGHRPPRAETVPGRSAAGSVHRHSAGASRARCAGLGAQREAAGHRRSSLRLGRHDPCGSRTRRCRRRSAACRYPARRHRSHPVHQRLDRRAQGRGVPASPFRRADRTAAQCLRHAAWRRRPADVPAIRAVRSGAGADLDHSRHGSDPPGERRPAQAAARDPRNSA